MNKTFGKEADVIVTSKDSAYYNLKGSVANGVMNQDGTYLVNFGMKVGSQFVHADDLELQEDVQDAPPHPDRKPPQLDVKLIPLHGIVPDPNNPRRHFDEIVNRELAESVKTQGVMQPIMVRPYTCETKGIKYMVVFGHRRLWAARAALLDEIPAIIREMSDDDALELQVIENLQRADIHPMHEAMAFKSMHQRLTTEEIAHRIGKGKTYVRTRLRLNHLTPEFQHIFLDGHINFETAYELTRASESVQAHILKESCKYFKPGQDGWKITNLAKLIQEGERTLDAAPFATDDEQLYAEMGACGKCPHNSGVNELFSDVSARVCNNPGCYAIKTERSYQQKVAQATGDPDVLLVSFYAHNQQELERVRELQKEGKSILKDGAVKLFSRKPEPTLADYKAKFNGLPEGQLENHFRHEHRKWEQLQEEIAAAEQDGRVKKAYIVAGQKAGTFQEVIVTKVAAPAPDEETGVPQTKPGISALLNNLQQPATRDLSANKAEPDDKTRDAHKAAQARRDATKLFFEVMRLDLEAKEPTLLLTDEVTAQALVLWDLLYELQENEQPLLAIQEWLQIYDRDLVLDANDMRVYDAIAKLDRDTRDKLVNKLTIGVLIQRWEGLHMDFTEDGRGAAVRQLARLYNQKAVEEIESKFLKPAEPAEKQLLRWERGRNIIKYATTPGAWKKLEGPFPNQEKMEARYQELLATGKYAEG